MSSIDVREALLRRFIEALQTGRVEALDEVLAPDFVDDDRASGQLPGALGMKWKLLAFRAHFPDAEVVLEGLRGTEDGLVATWRTTAEGLEGAPGRATLRFTARFVIDTRIRSTKLLAREVLAGGA